MPFSRHVCDVTAGDRIWRDGKYWLVTASTPANDGEGDWRLRLSCRNHETIWTYPADFDLAVADRSYVPSHIDPDNDPRNDTNDDVDVTHSWGQRWPF